MKVNFVFPSAGDRTGGVVVLYQLANGLARRGHEVSFLHGPAWPGRIRSLEDLPASCGGSGVRHLLVDDLDEPTLPAGDVVFARDVPPRLGHPCIVVQGHRLLPREMEEPDLLWPGPKVCVARWLMEVCRSFGTPHERLVRIPPGLDHELFSCRTPLDRRPIDVTALYHPNRSKGWSVAQTVLEQLSGSRPGLGITVFGRDTPPASLAAGARFLHWPDHRLLADEVYNRTRVFLQTSRFEGFGLAAVEAMACGAALVTTDNGGSREYAIDGDTAVVVPPDDPAAAVSAVDALLDDEPRRIQLAEAGSAFVRRFEWDLSAERLERFLVRYLADPDAFLSAVPGTGNPGTGS